MARSDAAGLHIHVAGLVETRGRAGALERLAGLRRCSGTIYFPVVGVGRVELADLVAAYEFALGAADAEGS